MSVQATAASAVFVLTIIAIATGRMRRSVATLLGASLLMAFNVIPAHRAVAYIDFNTIGLLMGMMIIVGVISRTGLFQYIAVMTVKATGGRTHLTFLSVLAVTARLSAFLDNLTTVLLVSPVVISLVDLMDVNPIPFLVGEAFASNIGGTATLVGDPPNIIIGNASKIPFLTFTALVFIPLAISFVVLLLMSRFSILKSLATVSQNNSVIKEMRTEGVITNPRLMIVSLSTLVIVVIGFIIHSVVDIEMSLFAILGAAFLLLYTGKDFDHMANEVDWNAILFFIGLFSLAYSLESSGIAGDLSRIAMKLEGNPILLSSAILWLSGFIAMITGAIPVVTIFIPIVANLSAIYPLPYDLWIALALGANLGGNGTLTGHLANIITFEMLNKEARKKNTFLDFLKLGFPFSVVSLAISNLYLIVRLLMIG